MLIFLFELIITEVFLFGDNELWFTCPSLGIGYNFFRAGSYRLL